MRPTHPCPWSSRSNELSGRSRLPRLLGCSASAEQVSTAISTPASSPPSGSARRSALTPKRSHIACVDAPSFPTNRTLGECLQDLPPQNSGLSKIAPPRRLPHYGKHIWHHRNGRRVSSRTSLLGIAW